MHAETVNFHCIMVIICRKEGKFGEILIWQLNSANTKPCVPSRLTTLTLGILRLCTVSLLQERYLYTPQRLQYQEFLSLSVKEIRLTNLSMRYTVREANRGPPRWSHLKAKRNTIETG